MFFMYICEIINRTKTYGKEKSDKETEPKKVSTKRFSAFLKNETTHFVIGLISVIFAVYLFWHLPLSSLRGPPTKVFWIISDRVN